MRRKHPISRIIAAAAVAATVLAFGAARLAGAQSTATPSAATPPATAPASADAPPLVGDADRAKHFRIAMCIGCHGIEDYRTAYPVVYSVPQIAGQNRGYIIAALKEYRAGERSHPTMRSIARGLSDQDIADLAAYYSSAKKPN